MPVYNSKKYIRKQLDSLLAQTYTNFEIVITDNCSTDETPQIIADYMARDSRIRYVRNETNIGLYSNFNRCFELARGEYFKWAADDDLHDPRFLEKAVAVLDSDPEVVMCWCLVRQIDSYGDEIPLEALGKGVYYDRDGHKTMVSPPDEHGAALNSPRITTRLRGAIHNNTWSYEIFGLCRRELMAKSSRHQDYYGSEKVCVVEFAAMGRIHTLPEVLFYYRRHPAQSTGIMTAKQRQSVILGATTVKRVKNVRLQNMKGMYRAAFRFPASPLDKLSAAFVVTTYYAKPSAWKDLFREMVLRLKARLAPKTTPLRPT
jgi:glycosyltransferase involved in cell wall biosynthesis